MIKPSESGHYETMGEALLLSEHKAASESGRAPLFGDGDRVRRVVHQQFDFIWRSLRRLGVPEANVDDAAQQVFVVAANKLAPVPVTGERGFLFAIALRVAADERRTRRRRPEVAITEESHDTFDSTPLADELLEQREARALIDRMLENMPLELRTVFVLFEMEDLTTAEIADLLEMPMGTVASRLRRAREAFQERDHQVQSSKDARRYEMSDPRRLKEEFAGDLQGRLLRSVARDAPRGDTRHRTLAALGFGGAALGLTGGTTASAAAKTATLGLLAKWIGIGVGAAVVAVGATYEAPRLLGYHGAKDAPSHAASVPIEPAPMAPAVAAEPVSTAPAAVPVPESTGANDLGAARPGVASGSAPRAPRTNADVAPASDDGAKSPKEPPLDNRLAVETPPTAPEAPGLSGEVAMLDGARHMISTNPAAALRALDEYQAKFPHGDLAPEALVLRIEALARSGQPRAAGKLAGDYLARNPGSPHARKIRAILGGAADW